MNNRAYSLKKRLYMLLLVCLVPLTCLIIYLMTLLNRFSNQYDDIVENITMVNAYNISFKEDMDYIMYIIAVSAERAEELVDTQQPYEMINEARETFRHLYQVADTDYAKNQIRGIMRSLNILEDRVNEIETDALVSGSYDKNMERLELNIRVLTDLIQGQIQEYIYYETTNLESLREELSTEVKTAIQMSVVIFGIILTGALLVSRKLVKNITEPIQKLCEVTAQAGQGDFEVRVHEESDDEIAVLNTSFNQMMEKIGDLVDDIKKEQLNLRATELKLLQAQINPHFLYNTLDAIIWLAESNQKEQVVKMVSSLSEFFRTTLSKGQDYISVREEEAHIRSYLEIQQFRYRDILKYQIDIPKELYQYTMLKLILQPIVENALYHGIKNKRGLGHIKVTGERKEDTLIFKVVDDGKGMSAERINQVRQMIKGELLDMNNKSGFGLFNVEQRINLNYGKGYGVDIKSMDGEGTEVTVTIPVIKK